MTERAGKQEPSPRMSSPERLGTGSAVGNEKLRSAKVCGRYAHLSGLEEQIMACFASPSLPCPACELSWSTSTPHMNSAPPSCHSAVWKWRQGDKGGEWVVTTLLRAPSLPLGKAGLDGVRRAQKKGEKGREWALIRNWMATNLMDSEITWFVSRHTHLFKSFRSFVLVPEDVKRLHKRSW